MNVQPDPISIASTAAPPANPLDLPTDINLPAIGQLGADMLGFFRHFAARLNAELLSDTIWLQLGGGVLAILLGYIASRLLDAIAGKLLTEVVDAIPDRQYRVSLRALRLPSAVAVVLWLIIGAFAARGLPVEFLRIAGAVLVATILSQVFALPRTDALWRWTLVTLIWGTAALIVFGQLGALVNFVDSIVIGKTLTLLDLFRAIVIAIALIWGASYVSRLFITRLNTSQHMTASVRGLFGQLVRIVMIGTAIVVALSTIGIDLTTFAVFTGALGVGIGFGLQSIFSNFVAGIIIILEKTLKVGDFVDLESGIRGEVQEINVRSTLIRNNDNIDMLVPNSEFINNRVINWTMRDASRRMHVPVGVAYGTNKDLVKKAMLEAAAKVEFTLKGVPGRKPDVWLVNFGDSSLDFELVVWLTDEATKRPARVHAAYCWEIETALAKYGITIPFPQRDLHVIRPKPSADPA